MHKKKWLILFTTIFLAASITFCRPTGQHNPSKKSEKDKIKNLLSSFNLKLKNNRRTLLHVIGFSLVTGVLLRNDQVINRRAVEFRSRNSWVSTVGSKITHLGDKYANYGIIGAFYIGGMIFKSERAKETAKLSLLSYVQATIAVELLKQLAGRPRPSARIGIDWRGPGTAIDNNNTSFPSGHTITAWSLATVVANQYRHKKWVPWVSYSLATLVGFSRVTEKKHWFSDVFVGSVLGYVIGKFTIRKKDRLFQIFPFLNGNGGVGMGMNLNLESL
ncbi:MAG: phosphatase PAP2 family protein [bacterium]|nr:phosphatase PAP2 family protein [bacterium]